MRTRSDLRGVTALVLHVNPPDLPAVMAKLSEEQVMHRVDDSKLRWIPILQS